MSTNADCRFCGGPLADFVDLGMSPLCESYLAKDQLNSMEPFYPLATYICHDCLLVQLEEYVAPERIFSEYAYFSAYSDSWLHHAGEYVKKMANRLGLGFENRVIELGSNDGFLLQAWKGYSRLTACAYLTSRSCQPMAAHCGFTYATPLTKPIQPRCRCLSFCAGSRMPACTSSKLMPILLTGFAQQSASY